MILTEQETRRLALYRQFHEDCQNEHSRPLRPNGEPFNDPELEAWNVQLEKARRCFVTFNQEIMEAIVEMSGPYQIISENIIYQVRKAAKMTQVQFAEHLLVNERLIRRCEQGNTLPYGMALRMRIRDFAHQHGFTFEINRE